MNSRAFLWFLITLIILLIVGWFLLIRPTSPAPASAIPLSTSTPAASTSTETQSSTPAATLDPATVAAAIVGNWQSTDDSNYTVTITANGKWTDSYGRDPNATQTGTYSLFTSANPDKDFTGILVPGVVYVKVVEGSSTLYFSVLEATTDALQLSYLDRGNTLSFVRMQ